MTRTLLISSNPDNQAVSEEFDIYVHFNSCIHFDKFPPEKSIVMVRSRKACAITESKSCHSVCPNECYKKIGKCDHDCKITGNPGVILVVGNPQTYKGYNAIDLNNLSNFYYPTGKSPTTGFFGINYFLQQGHEVFLLGFNLEVAPYRQSRSHSIDYEIEEVGRMIASGEVFSV
jgi:hypothetical protein